MNYSIDPKNLALLLLIPLWVGCSGGAEKSEKKEEVTDIEGNVYPVVRIGKQVWMAADLKTTQYSDGSSIPQVEDYEEWASLETAAYCWYNNDSASSNKHGALYNLYVVESEKLCPEGWHVPSDEEWIEIESVYGGAGIAGDALKEAGTTSWKPPNGGATNESGFAARPGGYRSYNGTYNLMRIEGYWWSVSEASWYGSESTVVYRNLSYDRKDFGRNVAAKTNGFSVRCVKNP
jgi:uncharacterized protein (TIGR02145 family)